MPMNYLPCWHLVVALLLAGLQSAFGQTETAQRASTFAYDGQGLLTTETIEPTVPDLCVKTVHAADGFGNRKRSTVSNCPGAGADASFTTRSTDTEYGRYVITVASMTVDVPAGTFPTLVTNALGQSEQRQHDPRFGGLASLTGPNGLTTQWRYDPLGRKVLEIAPDGNRIVTRHCFLAGPRDLSGNSPGCIGSPTHAPSFAVSYVETQPQSAGGVITGPYVRKYSDSLGRVIREETQGYDGAGQPSSARIVVTDSEYNDFGALVKATQPYFIDSGGKSSLAGSGGAAGGWTVTDYDFLGRPVRIDVRDNEGNQTALGQTVARKTIEYVGLTVTESVHRTSKNSQGQQQSAQVLKTTRLTNALGQVIEVKDALNASLRKRYDPFGNLVETQDGLDNRVRTAYDTRGRRLQMADPNSGTWKYRYNALGELTGQQNPNQAVAGHWSIISHDVLGRIKQRTEPGDYVTTWTYDTCAKGVGKLCQVGTDHGVTKTFGYDAYGRPASSTQAVSGQPSAFTATTAYDPQGRVGSYTYPTGVALTYTYTPLGFLAEIKRGPDSVWRMGSASAWGKPESFDLGPGTTQNTRLQYDPVTGRSTQIAAGAAGSILMQTYGWDSVGNLTDRTDLYDGTNVLSENFGYDQVNRLVNYGTSAPTMPGLSKNVTMSYDAIGNITRRSDVGTYSYLPSGPSSVRPSAVRTVNGVSQRTYSYDAAGNLLNVATSSGNPTRYSTLTYTSFSLPRTVVGPDASYDWGYGPDHERVRETKAKSGNSRVTWYFHSDKANGLAFEQEVLNGGTPVNRHYVSAMGRTVMVLETSGTIGSGAAQTPSAVQYWHVDQLGSVSAITDASGQVKQRSSFDPSGKRRNLNGEYDALSTIVHEQVGSQGTDRGFTGHEHLDDVGIIHMNGRTYDARIGRFMQPDPYIQFEDNLQSYNRYSYVLNNPLNATDPSGEFIPVIMYYVGVQVAMAGMKIAVISTLTQAFIAGAVGGALSSFTVKGGNPIKGAVAGGVSAAAFYSVGSLGNWHEGAPPSPTTEFSSWFAKTSAHAVTGCATSAMSGGRCRSGAIGAGLSAALGFALPSSLGEEGNAEHALVHTLIGGIAAQASGGSFTNGAATAAFGYLFNDVAADLSRGGKPSGLDLHSASNFAAGVGDTLSFGGTAVLRSALDIGNVDKDSLAYSSGEAAGIGISMFSGAGVGFRLAGAKGKGLEFSHWWPNRWGGARSLYNGNYVTKVEHALSDPYRYQFMARSWKATNPMPSPMIQQWNRIPWVWKGTGFGAAYGGLSVGVQQ